MNTPALWRAAGIFTLAWLLAWLVAVLATRPLRGVRATRDRAELGEGPPALAGLLASGLRLGEDAVPATVLDLAARGWLAFERVGPHPTVGWLRSHGDGGRLWPYERRVLAHVAARTGRDGRAAASALGEDVAGWREQFEQEVLAHARARGFTAPRTAVGLRALYRLAAVVPALLVTAGLLREGVREWALFYGFLGYLTWAILNLMVRVLRGERLTRAGRGAAAHWLGVRAALRNDPALATLSPAAVVPHDRRVAYGAALGAAPAAVAALRPPVGNRAWSSYEGTWHQVRIGPHGTRTAPAFRLYLALLFGGMGLFFLFVMMTMVRAGHIGLLALIPLAMTAVGLATAAVMGASFLRGMSAPRRVEVTGQVVRRWVVVSSGDGVDIEQPCIAVDDGRSGRAPAWTVSWDTYEAVRVGATVRVLADPQRNRLLRLTVLEQPSAAPPPEPRRR